MTLLLHSLYSIAHSPSAGSAGPLNVSKVRRESTKAGSDGPRLVPMSVLHAGLPNVGVLAPPRSWSWRCSPSTAAGTRAPVGPPPTTTRNGRLQPGSDCRRRGCRHSTRAHRADAHSPSPSGTGCRAGHPQAGIAALAGGRLTVLGIIGSMDREFTEFGLDPDLKARGRALDERLACVQELWRQWGAPEIPLWCGAVAAQSGLRRAARFDGVLHLRGPAWNSTAPVETFADAVALCANSPATDLSTSRWRAPLSRGQLPGTSPPYAAAGATWWVEAMGWWRGALATARDRITAGPPA